jgi:hypothetical protein
VAEAGTNGATAAVGGIASPRAEPFGALRDVRIWLRLAVALVVAVAVLSVVLALAAPLLNLSEDSVATARHDAVILVPSCLVVLLVLLYGQATSCPRCGKWWARTEGETECVSREVFDRGGRSWARSLRLTHYACKFCRHIWSVTSTDEYEGSARPRSNGRR